MKNSIISQKISHNLNLLKFSYGILFILTGLDKFFNFIVDWQQYINPAILSIIDYSVIKIITATIEIALGIFVLKKNLVKFGAYGMAIWFFIIIINLITMWNYLDIIARDFILAIGAIVMGNLSYLTEQN